MGEFPESQQSDATEEQFLGELIDRISEGFQAGEDVDLQSYVRQHPERAEQIEKLLPTLELLAGMNSSPAAEDGPDADGGPADEATGVTGQTLGDYRIGREIGRGGMGVVYEAEQVSLGRRVALKVLPFASVFDQRQIKRFQNEAQAAAQLHHQHIVPVFAVGCERGVHYYAMQYIEGQTLADAITQLRERSRPESKGRWRRFATTPGSAAGSAGSPSESPTSNLATVSTSSREFERAVAEIGIQAADALAYAHQVGVVHRDIKPANLLLDGLGNVWITDFGLAQFKGDASVTLSGDILGTLRYMSPEQALGKRVDVDERTDVYSFGITLYELLTLEPAVSGKDREEILRKVSFEDPPRPRKLRPSIPQELETIVLKAIEKNPRERYSSATELAEDLRLFLADKPIRARRPTTAQRLIKWSRRHRTLVASLCAACALALVLVAVGASVVALHFDRVAGENARVAEDNKRVADENKQVASANGLLAEQRRERLVRLFVANGARLFDTGDTPGALVWFASALELDQGDPEREVPHRMRIASTLERCPRLRRVWFDDAAEVPILSPDGRRMILRNQEEWTLWDDASGQEIARQPGRFETTAFSPDGRRLLTTGEGKAQVWDATTGVLVTSLEATRESLEKPVFSLDGRRIAALTHLWDHPWKVWGGVAMLEVWDAESGARIGEPLEVGGPRAWPRFSPDGSQVAFVNRSASVEVRDLATGKSVVPADRRLRHGKWIGRIQFNGNGRLLASASGDGTVQVWRTDTWERVALLEHAGVITSSMVFSPDGRFVATGSKDGLIRLWIAENGWLVQAQRVSGHSVDFVKFSPDGRWILAASGGAVTLWNYDTDSVLELHGEDTISDAWFSIDGRFVAVRRRNRLAVWDFAVTPSASPALTGSRTRLVFDVSNSKWGSRYFWANHPDGGARIFDSHLGQALNEPRSGSPNVWTAAFSPDGRLVATAGIDGTARVWDAATFVPVTAPLHQSDSIFHVSFSPDSRLLVTVSEREARVWRVATGAPETAPLVHEGHVLHAAFSPDSRLVATAGQDKIVQFWNLSSGKAVGTPLVHESPAQMVLFTPDGRYLVTATKSNFSGSVHVWDVATHELKHKLGQAWATHVSLRPDGREIVAALSGGGNGRSVVWDLETGEEVVRSTTVHNCCEVANFSPDGRLVASGGVDQRAVISDAITGEPRLALTHRNAVFDARFSPLPTGGRWLLTASFDGRAQLWDARTGEWVTPPFEHRGPLLSARFSPDGKRFLTASHVARVREIPLDERPVEELLDLAHLLAGRRVDPAANHLVGIAEDFRGLYERVREKRPDDLVLPPERELAWHQRMAEDASHERRWKKAVVHLDAAIEAEPWRYTNLVRRGHARAELGRWPEPAEDFERAVTLGEKDPWVQHCQAIAHLAAGDLESYRAVAERMLARFSADASSGAIRWLGWTCALAPGAVSDLDAVIRLLESAREEDSEDRMTTLSLGALHFRAGRLQTAVALLAEVADDAGSSTSSGRLARLFLALAEAARGRFDEARVAFDSAVEASLNESFWSLRLSASLLEDEAGAAVLGRGFGTPEERLARFRKLVDAQKWTSAGAALEALDRATARSERETLVKALTRSARSLLERRLPRLAAYRLDLAEKVDASSAELWRVRAESFAARGRNAEALAANQRAIDGARALGQAGRDLVAELGEWRLALHLERKAFEAAREAAEIVVSAARGEERERVLEMYLDARETAAMQNFASSGSNEARVTLHALALISAYRAAARGEPVGDKTLAVLGPLVDDERQNVADVILVDRSAPWKYLDDGSDPGTAWRELAFDDRTWREGPAPLGFGDNREATRLEATSADGKPPVTYYFRRRFTFDQAEPPRGLLLQLVRDDGAVVYLNGREVVRDNLPENGEIDHSTLALNAAGGIDETKLREFPLARAFPRRGENVLAVEVHQSSPSSSDVHFEASLQAILVDARSYLAGLDATALKKALRAADALLPPSVAAEWGDSLRLAWETVTASSAKESPGDNR